MSIFRCSTSKRTHRSCLPGGALRSVGFCRARPEHKHWTTFMPERRLLLAWASIYVIEIRSRVGRSPSCPRRRSFAFSSSNSECVPPQPTSRPTPAPSPTGRTSSQSTSTSTGPSTSPPSPSPVLPPTPSSFGQSVPHRSCTSPPHISTAIARDRHIRPVLSFDTQHLNVTKVIVDDRPGDVRPLLSRARVATLTRLGYLSVQSRR